MTIAKKKKEIWLSLYELQTEVNIEEECQHSLN